MKILLQNILTGLLFLTAMSITAQVLWSDNFDSYPVGLLSTDPTGVNPGYGNWYVTTLIVK